MDCELSGFRGAGPISMMKWIDCDLVSPDGSLVPMSHQIGVLNNRNGDYTDEISSSTSVYLLHRHSTILSWRLKIKLSFRTFPQTTIEVWYPPRNPSHWIEPYGLIVYSINTLLPSSRSSIERRTRELISWTLSRASQISSCASSKLPLEMNFASGPSKGQW